MEIEVLDARILPEERFYLLTGTEDGQRITYVIRDGDLTIKPMDRALEASARPYADVTKSFESATFHYAPAGANHYSEPSWMPRCD